MSRKKRSPSGFRPLLLGVAFVPYAFIFASPGDSKSDFDADVAPVLKAHCVSCHTGSGASGGLDLSTIKGLRKGGLSGSAVAAGHPEASLIVQRMKGLGGKPQMPMGFPAVSSEDIGKIEKWIRLGAPIGTKVGLTHWAYIPPVRPQVPSLNSSWIRNPIDAFILARIKRAGLTPSPEAPKEVLLRRVTLDLTGLPPTLAETDLFLADKSPNAYAKVVDRLLASPHYGEKQARGWLDLARYADSDGYEKDLKRTAWPFRDWVIDAFNRNLPYDQFTIKQLAGDLLQNPTLQDRVATGFQRNTMQNLEGGVDQDEAHFQVILDRVDTTSTVWLGSTLGCAKCHDHKYDPFTQRDYYKLAAFYSNTVVLPRGPKEVGEEKWLEPTLRVETPSQVAEQSALKQAITNIETRLQQNDPSLNAAFEEWKRNARQPISWQILRPIVAVTAEATFQTSEEGVVTVSGKNPARAHYSMVLPSPTEPTTGIRIEAMADPEFGGNGPGRAENGNFVMTGLRIVANGKLVKIRDIQADFIQDGYALDHLNENKPDSGWAVVPRTGKSHRLVAVLSEPLPVKSRISIELSFDSTWAQHTLGKFRITATSAPDPTVDLLPERVGTLLTSRRLASSEEAELGAYFRLNSPARAELRKELSEAKTRLETIQNAIPSALVLEEKPTNSPLTAYVRHRGEFLSKTELVTAGTPAVLPPLKDSKPNRLSLAQWLVSPGNPLTARVEMNRMWEQYFGRGLVETSEDFGTRGSLPTHPELLDWLATEFMARKWDMKAMHRMIVMSSAYRQSSNATEELLAKDPQNLLISRGPRFRLDAEAIRDSALAAGGLLSFKVGGPSVYPYQPEGIWDSPYSGESWMASNGSDRFRRSIYTFWKRTAPFPSFLSFDATSRESCTVRRIRTNTPLQALTMLNDQEMIYAAEGLAQRMKKSGRTPEIQLTTGFRLCTGRKPTLPELRRLKNLEAKLEQRYTKNPSAATRLAGSPDRAAWTMVGNVLLNLDETLTKE